MFYKRFIRFLVLITLIMNMGFAGVSSLAQEDPGTVEPNAEGSGGYEICEGLGFNHVILKSRADGVANISFEWNSYEDAVWYRLKIFSTAEGGSLVEFLLLGDLGQLVPISAFVDEHHNVLLGDYVFELIALDENQNELCRTKQGRFAIQGGISGGGPCSGYYIVVLDDSPYNGPANLNIEGDDYDGRDSGACLLIIHGNDNPNIIYGGQFTDMIYGYGSDDLIYGGGGNDWIYAGAGNDRLYGEDGLDVIYGNDGNDWISGGASSDALFGDDGADTVYGNAGDDLIAAGAGDDELYGGEGVDTFNAEDATNDMSVDLIEGTSAGGSEVGYDALDGFENAITGSGNDFIIGTDDANILISGGGDDTLFGYGGDDVLEAGCGADRLSGGSGNDIIDGGAGADTFDESQADSDMIVDLVGGTSTGGTDELIGIYNVTTGEGDDLITGNDKNNVLVGNGGTDYISGGAGNDRLTGGAGDDTLLGGDGTDTFDESGAESDMDVDLTRAANQSTGGADVGTDQLSDIENITTGSGTDSIIGDDVDNVIDGGGGDDTIDGGGGSDTFYAGWVTVDMDVNLATGTSTDNGAGVSGDDTLASIENVITGWGDDIITGNDEDNILDGAGGDDTIDGGGGVDTFDAGSAYHDMVVDLNAGTSVGGYEIGSDTLTNIENVNTGSGDDVITGSSGDNVLNAGTGTDTLDESAAVVDLTVDLGAGTSTGLGSDTLIGFENVTTGSGNDTIIGDDGDNILNGGEGDDVIDGGGGSDTYDAHDAIVDMNVNLGAGTATGMGNDTLTNLENVVTGSGNDTIIGDDGDNILNGGAGDDVIDGGGGSDTFDASDALADVTVDLGAGTATGGDIGSDTLLNIENATTGWGDDTLLGDDGNNILNGGPGDDTLTGGAGDDTLIGGDWGLWTWRDWETNWVNWNVDWLAEQGSWWGSDTFDASGATSDMYVYLHQGLSFGGADVGNDTLYRVDNVNTGSGSDQIYGDDFDNVLNGGAGNDIIDGRGGNNTYSAAHATGDVEINLSAGRATGGAEVGIDILISIQNAIGGAGNDTLIGNAISNILQGGAGDDILIGGGGSDTFSAADASADVTVNLATGTATGGDIGSDTLIDISNAITGSGNDTLIGSAGDNSFDGGAGDDNIDGGGGVDTFDVHDTTANMHVDLRAGTASGMGSDTLNNIENVTTGWGHDFILGDDGDNLLIGGAGYDEIHGLDGDDVIEGGTGWDTIYGGGGSDHIDGGTGDDTIYGGWDNSGGQSRDDVGTDVIYGGADCDVIFGGNRNEGGATGHDGDDIIRDNSGSHDHIYGGNLNDNSTGHDGNDTITDLNGRYDIIYGGNYNRNGGIGNDNAGFSGAANGGGDTIFIADGAAADIAYGGNRGGGTNWGFGADEMVCDAVDGHCAP